MRELSLHVLDIVQNSINAAASLISVYINEDIIEDLLTIKIKDNGRGIPEENLSQITDPFFTSRKTREVGLGLSLFAEAAWRCDGDFKIDSIVEKGTEVETLFRYSHIDRAPLGDIQGTLLTLIALNPGIDFIYHHLYMNKEFLVDTREIKKELEGIEINQKEILEWLGEFLREGFIDLYGGER